MRHAQLNDEYLHLVEKQRLYFKTVRDFQEVSGLVWLVWFKRFVVDIEGDVNSI